MRYFGFILGLFLFLPLSLTGQTTQSWRVQTLLNNEQQADTTVVVVVRESIFNILSAREANTGSVRVYQNSSIDSLMNRYVRKASGRNLTGHRIRIFNSNAQNARDLSLEIETKFKELYPDVAVYRSFVDPNFRVTVGDFRTKSEAEKFKRVIGKEFPGTFIIRDSINFPAL